MGEVLSIEKLKKEKFNKYGEIISIKDIKPKIEEENFTFWNELAIMDPKGPIDFAFLEVVKRENNYKTLERHVKTGEAYIALDENCILFLTLTKNEQPDFDTAKAFLIEAGKGVILSKNTWHWLPYPLADSAHLLVLSRKGTLENDLEKINIKNEFNKTFKLKL